MYQLFLAIGLYAYCIVCITSAHFFITVDENPLKLFLTKEFWKIFLQICVLPIIIPCGLILFQFQEWSDESK